MTIALCVICKNEKTNLPRLLRSVEGCFDQIHITDTGSTDGTLEWLEQYTDIHPEVYVHHFKWVDDFAKARNFSFSHSPCDYTMWLDCDDVMSDKEAFKQWKDSLLPTANYWVATYNYALDKSGNPTCSFMRERVVKTDMGFEWQHFVHEGIPPKPKSGNLKMAYATSWSVNHMRSEEDVKVDRNRNLSMFDKNKDQLEAHTRLQYYYGKELFEAGKPLEAYSQLVNAAKKTDLEMHDRILCMQYACMAAMLCNQFPEAIQMAHQGLQLMPQRAEFHVVIGDCYLKMNQIDNAIPSFVAASECKNQSPNDAAFQSAIFTNADAYGHYPRNQLCRIYFHKNDINRAKYWLEQGLALGHNVETGALYAEILKLEEKVAVKPKGSIPVVDEYFITCPQVAAYLWDEQIAKTRGVGGSEIAAIRMARLLHEKTGKTVRIFNQREKNLDLGGVVYHRIEEIREMLATRAPKAHIAWRHNLKVTEAPTYLWCHDLAVPGIEGPNFDKILALSPFHKDYLKHIFRVPEDKIMITRNGIDMNRFIGKDFETKNPHKIVFSSSPDRGLDRAAKVVERAIAKSGLPLELHCFYGFDNMAKLGMHDEVARIKGLINRPWVKFHGNVQQEVLIDHIKDAKVWLYPTDFLETFCITALEMLACRVRPIVRSWGALRYTLDSQPAKVILKDCVTDDEIDFWADALLEGLEAHQPMVDMSPYTWDSVAEEWISWMPK